MADTISTEGGAVTELEQPVVEIGPHIADARGGDTRRVIDEVEHVPLEPALGQGHAPSTGTRQPHQGRGRTAGPPKDLRSPDRAHRPP